MNKQKYIDLFESNLNSAIDLWLTRSPDREHGGIYHCLDRDGNVFSRDKGVWMQGRAGWTFSYLYNHYQPRPEFLEIAKSCIDFAREKCTDKDGRMYVKVTKDGAPLEKSGEWFSEAFYIMACAEYYRATGDRDYLYEARVTYDLILAIFRDPSVDPYRVSHGGSQMARPTRHFNQPMILLNVGAVMAACDPERISLYNENALWLGGLIRDFFKEEYGGTLESIAPDGSVILDAATERVCCPGHDMECAWFLLEEGRRLGNTEMCSLAARMFDCAYAMGLDREYGGILYYRDILPYPVEAYEQDMKIWWVHNEAIIASLALFCDTGSDLYREIFEKTVEYSFARFVDSDGEWYATLRRDGVPNETMIKGFIYKGPFHTVRMYAKCLEMLRGEKADPV